jgi:AAA domain (dynein-related subfamily)
MSTKTWDDTFSAIVHAGVFPHTVHRVLISGWPRTGKSTLPGKLFGADNVERTTVHRQMPVDDLIGGMAMVNGTTVWQDGPAVRALRHGKKLVLDEIDRHSGEIYSFILAIADDPAGVTLPTGERVNAAQGYGLIATTNEPPSKLADALYDRFDLVLKADTLSRGLQQALGEFAECAQNVIGRGGAGQRVELKWTRPATVNLFIAASKLRKHGCDDERIAELLGLTESETVDFLAAIAPRS